MLSRNFDDALALASALHRDQTRKGTPIPYVAHLLGVADLVLEANAYHPCEHIEDLAIAALLHDAIEDQGDKITIAQIRERYGDRVHDIVRDCTDAVAEDGTHGKAPWRQRKEAYIASIGGKSTDSLLVSCADKLHNARAILFDHARMGEAIWRRFSPGRDQVLWYYGSLADAFSQAWPENPLLPDLRAAVAGMRQAADDRPASG